MTSANNLHNKASTSNQISFPYLPLNNTTSTIGQIDPSSLFQAQSLLNHFLASSYQNFFKQHHETPNPFFNCPQPPLHHSSSVSLNTHDDQVNGKFFPNFGFINRLVSTASTPSQISNSSKENNGDKDENSRIRVQDEATSIDIEKSLIYQ